MAGDALARRCAWRALATAAVGLVAAIAATGSAGASTEAYPNGGANFDADGQGFTPSGESCSVQSGLSVLCSASASHQTSGGNPGGRLTAEVTVTANLAGVFSGSVTWTSPSFTVPAAGGDVTSAGIRYDRAFDAAGLVDLTPSSTVTPTLVDETAGTETPIAAAAAPTAFATRVDALVPGLIVPGHSYRLRMVTTTSSTVAAANVLGTSTTSLDNVALTVARAGDGSGGGGGNAGGGGNNGGGNGGNGGNGGDGTRVRDPISGSRVDTLLSNLNVNADQGANGGGSAIPLAQCTIVGTPGPDRIRGTAGNDVICGLGGNDTIAGGRGRDIIDGGAGNDRLAGGTGNDALIGVRGADRLNGGAGNDRLGGGAGNDRLAAAGGRDRLNGGAGEDRLNGGAGKDRLSGAAGNDQLAARDRTRDVVDGGSGRDRASVDVAKSRRGRSAGRQGDTLRRVERVRR